MTNSTDGVLAGIIIVVLVVVFILFACHYRRESTITKKVGGKAVFVIKKDDKGQLQTYYSQTTEEEKNDIEKGNIVVHEKVLPNKTVASILFLKNVTKYGYLSKKSTSGRLLKRWFFIKKGHLFYTHTFDEINNDHVEAFKVSNLQISTVKVIDQLTFKIISPGARELGQGGEYELHGDDPIDVKEWVDAILKVIKGELDHSLTPSDTEPKTSTELFVPNQRVLNILKKHNPVCVDCGAKDPEWASLNLCVMMCIECSGTHRKLGAHISKVRSTTLDKWTKNNIRLLIAIGNERANMLWEGMSNPNDPNISKPNSSTDRESRSKYIVEKYSKKLFLPPHLNEEVSVNSLLESASNGDALGINKAIIAGIDINIQNETDLRTPLHLAVIGKHQLCVELICQWNAFTDIHDSLGLTPFDLAKEQNNTDLMIILERNASARNKS
jgi:hypothetical protein